MKHSEVRNIPKEEYDVQANKYMQAYSFILSWGWKRKLFHEDEHGNKIYHWVSEGGKYSTPNIYEAESIQRLKLITGDTSRD